MKWQLSLKHVLAKQRREIEEAKTLNSDLEFAFNLQMQEAMTASLSILNHPPSTALASSSTPKSEEVEDFDCCSTLFLENIERLEQERKDREESEHLMREMREDLDRRIHDKKIASDSRTEAHTSGLETVERGGAVVKELIEL